MPDSDKYQDLIKKHGVAFELLMKIHLGFHHHSAALALLFSQHDQTALYHDIVKLYTMLPAQILYDVGEHFGLSAQQVIAILHDVDQYLQNIGAVSKPTDLH